ncbi:MAG: hypothetical protein AVDCRST_MAG15-1392 [uncultured Rubellimicrobium sp.]|uniref:Uncharacterized protein n=1 Tax=uncultured Rubellimicrobium sp. TaxID=543078 RepID=A0A6J4P7V4_9RHOB|nr:MAG: hypothetical protein AVDCRST_MAG15-1392 [uncultured Rubellimicrobium sp.]
MPSMRTGCFELKACLASMNTVQCDVAALGEVLGGRWPWLIGYGVLRRSARLPAHQS